MKVNLVFSGGEMRGGYVGGFLLQFTDNFYHKLPELNIYAVSASVATSLYFLNFGEYKKDKYEEWKGYTQNIWLNELSKERGWLRNGRFSLDVDSVIKVFKMYPFNEENIYNSKHTLIFPIYNVTWFRIDYFSNKKIPGTKWMGDYDIYEVVRAAISAPVVYDKFVKLGKSEYCDPGVIEHFVIPGNGLPTIYVPQNNQTPRLSLQSFFFYLRAIFSEHALLNIVFGLSSYNQSHLYKKVGRLVKSKKAIHLEQIKKLSGGNGFDLTEKELERNFNIGMKTFEENKENIEKYLGL